jgi:hypothetical protein
MLEESACGWVSPWRSRSVVMTENDVDVVTPGAEPPSSWAERHGALLLGGGLALVLVLVVILDWVIRGSR